MKNTKIKEQNDVILTFVEDPVHDCWDPFQVFCFYLDKCHPQAKKFYARIIKPGGAEAKNLKAAFGKEIWFAESGAGRTNWNMGPTKHRNLCTEIAVLSGVDDYSKCTGHALRALCITHCIGAGLSAADVAAKVRHAAINSSKTYAEECNKRKANRMACMNPSQKLATKSKSKRPPTPEEEVVAVKEVVKRPKVVKTQPMLPENRQRFEDLVADSSVRTPSSIAASVASLPVENNENLSPDSEFKLLKKQNEILKLKAENARLQQEISNTRFVEPPRSHHRQSYPPFTHHRGFENYSGNHSGYRHSYPPPNRRHSRSPSPPRYDRRSHQFPKQHGHYYEEDYSGYSDYYRRGY